MFFFSRIEQILVEFFKCLIAIFGDKDIGYKDKLIVAILLWQTVKQRIL